MGRRAKLLQEYAPHPDLERVDDKFDEVVSTDPVDFICKCGIRVNSMKRLIAARLLKGRPLICQSCKNKMNRAKGTKKDG